MMFEICGDIFLTMCKFYLSASPLPSKDSLLFRIAGYTSGLQYIRSSCILC